MNYEGKTARCVLDSRQPCGELNSMHIVHVMCTAAGVLLPVSHIQYLCQMSWTSWCVELHYDLSPRLVGGTNMSIIIIIICAIGFCIYALWQYSVSVLTRLFVMSRLPDHNVFDSTLTGRICCFHPMLGRRWWASPLSTPLFLNDWLSSRQAPLVHAWFFTWTEGWGFGRGHGLLWSGLGSREVETRLRVENRIWLLRVRVSYKMCRLSRLTCRTHTLVGRRGRCPSGPRGLCLSSCFVSLCSSPMSLPASSGETKRQHSESVVRKNETKHSVNEWTSSSNTQFTHIL